MAAKTPHRIRNFSQALVYTVIIVAILGVLNFLANRYNKSYDSTANKRYTLSDQSAKIAREAKQDITISYWDSPAQFPNARDLFDRYQNLSPKIKVAYNDIDKNLAAARAAGVTKRGEIFVQVGNKKEEAKSLTEEEVTGAMVRALKGGDRTVCFTSGYGEGDTTSSDQRNGYSAVKDLTEHDNYVTKVVAMLPTPDIPMDCTILVVNGPKRDYLPPAVDAVKKYVEDGGRALILLDPPLKFGSSVVDDNAALVAVVKSWGVDLKKNLVLDVSGVGRLFGMGPEMPVVSSYESHAIVQGMGSAASAFPLARSLEVANTDKTAVQALFKTTDAAVTTSDLSSPQVRVDSGTEGARTLGAAGTYDTGTEGKQGRFVVVGTSDWISNGVLGFAGNRDLYLNMLNWLSADEDLISIRPKNPEDRRLNINARQMTFLFYGSVVGLPLLMTLAGVSVWWRRR